MVDVKMNKASYNRLMNSLQGLTKRIDDMNPVWDKFVKWYPKEIIEKAFDTRGKIYGTRWPKYSPAYLRFKQKKYSGKQMLVIDGTLKKDSTDNIKTKKSKHNMSFIINNKLAAIHHYNKKKARKIIAGKDDKIPARALTYLMEEMYKHIKGDWR